jgi:1-aminocyclopropane-1-carboxylate deaminase/D-cysteine desulfhydrase-like pyridoxal-dependent ACC family enzyme
LRHLVRSLKVEDHHLGRGYGYPTEWGATATTLAGRAGLVLDPTYTAKAFAAALRLMGCKQLPEAPAKFAQLAEMIEYPKIPGRPRVLYWHTLSAVAEEGHDFASSATMSLPTAIRELLHTK